LRGSRVLPVPGAIALQGQRGRWADLRHEPPRASRGQPQAQGSDPYSPLVFTALVLAEAGDGLAITEGDCYRPSFAVLREEPGATQREGGGKKGFPRRQRLARAKLGDARQWWTAPHYHTDQPPRKDGLPQPLPRLDARPGCGGMGLPAGPFAGPGFGGPQKWTFFRGTSPAWGKPLGRQGRERAGDEHPGDPVHPGRQLGQRVRGSIAAIAQPPHLPRGELRGDKIHAVPRQGTAGLIRQGHPVCLFRFEVER
jgi:hypothetical protein